VLSGKPDNLNEQTVGVYEGAIKSAMVFPVNGYRASQRVRQDYSQQVYCLLQIGSQRNKSRVAVRVALCLEAIERMTNRLRRTGARFVSYRNTSNSFRLSLARSNAESYVFAVWTSSTRGCPARRGAGTACPLPVSTPSGTDRRTDGRL